MAGTSGHLALYRKWRPLTFKDVYGQEHITRALSAQVENGAASHAYLFTGTRGTGKTTCAKILARAVNCLAPVEGNPCNKCQACQASLAESALDITEIDAASNNGVDNIREMRDEAFFAPAALKKRVYIIDEVHMLSQGAFNALLKILEEPPAHVLFILATTEIHKVPATILSRCQRYDFRRIPAEIIAGRLEHIAENEGVGLTAEAAGLLAARGDGSMRDAISLMDRSMSAGAAEINRQTVEEALGLSAGASVVALLEAVLASDGALALELFTREYIMGRDMVSLFDELLTLIRDVYVIKATGDTRFLTSAGQDLAVMKDIAGRTDSRLLEFFVACISDLLRRLTRTAMGRTDGEMCILKMCLRHTGDSGLATGAAAVPKAAAIVPAAAAASATAAVPKAVPAEELPWEAEGGQKRAAQPAAARPEGPVAKAESAPTGEGTQLLGSLVAAVGSRVNSAVRTYLSLASAQNIDNTLYITVAEESLVFMNKPAVLDVLNEGAASLGLGGVNISEKPPEGKAAKPSAVAGILSRARDLGIEVKTRD